MNIASVMDQLGQALASINGLRVFAYNAPRITPPCAVVGWPEPITYDGAMARGMDELTLPIYVMVGSVDQRTARDVLAGYLDGSGAHSVKAAIDGHHYTACDSARVASASIETFTSAGTDYLGALLQVEITGAGA